MCYQEMIACSKLKKSLPQTGLKKRLSELLRETGEKREDTIRRLEEQRRQIQGMIKQLQKNLGIIRKRLRALN